MNSEPRSVQKANSYQFQQRISVLEASRPLEAISQHCAKSIQAEFTKFGVELVNFFFHSINIPEEDASYQRLKVLKEKTAELNLLGREIYQYDRSMEVLKTAAANECGGGGGLMQAGVGLAVGAGLGQQMAQQMGQLTTQLAPASAPPALPGAPAATAYHVAVNGQQLGPFPAGILQQMIPTGTLHAASLVWRPGLAGWQAAATVPELAGLFAPATPPPAPLPPPLPPAS